MLASNKVQIFCKKPYEGMGCRVFVRNVRCIRVVGNRVPSVSTSKKFLQKKVINIKNVSRETFI